MGWFIAAGGLPGVIVLVFGLVLVGYAVGFVRRPVETKVRAIKGLGAGVIAAGLGGFAANLIAVSRFVGEQALPEGEVGKVLVIGLGESLTPVVSAFTLVAVAAILTTLGLRRQA
jgi:hypothetical protein